MSKALPLFGSAIILFGIGGLYFYKAGQVSALRDLSRDKSDEIVIENQAKLKEPEVVVVEKPVTEVIAVEEKITEQIQPPEQKIEFEEVSTSAVSDEVDLESIKEVEVTNSTESI